MMWFVPSRDSNRRKTDYIAGVWWDRAVVTT